MIHNFWKWWIEKKKQKKNTKIATTKNDSDDLFTPDVSSNKATSYVTWIYQRPPVRLDERSCIATAYYYRLLLIVRKCQLHGTLKLLTCSFSCSFFIFLYGWCSWWFWEWWLWCESGGDRGRLYLSPGDIELLCNRQKNTGYSRYTNPHVCYLFATVKINQNERPHKNSFLFIFPFYNYFFLLTILKFAKFVDEFWCWKLLFNLRGFL